MLILAVSSVGAACGGLLFGLIWVFQTEDGHRFCVYLLLGLHLAKIAEKYLYLDSLSSKTDNKAKEG